MGKKEDLIKDLRRFKAFVNKDLAVEKVIFFGSRASGKPNKNSDVDLIIVSDRFTKMNPISRASKMYDYWEIGLPVDFLCYTKREFNQRKNRITIVREAVLNGIEIN